jgi:restriction modification system DNA specificity domain protein
MSQIDKLIADLCPDGVSHYQLGEIAGYSDTRAQASYLDKTTFVGVDNLLSNKGGRVDASHAPNTSSLTAYETGDLLLGNIRPYLKKIWLSDRTGGCSGDVLAVRLSKAFHPIVDARFLYYTLSSDKFFSYATQHSKGAKMPRGDKAAILKFRVPVPPLEVQREIVRVLDKFTQLEAELEAELEARRRQYEYYLDRLVSFRGENEVPWVAIGDLGLIFRGKRFTKSDYVDSDGIGVIHYGEIYTRYGTTANQAVSQVRPDLGPALRYAYKGDVILTDVGETVEDVGKAVAWLGEEPVAVHDHCYVIRSELDASYLAYTMQGNDFRKAKEQAIARTKVKTLLLDGLKRIKVPIPPLEEQRRIVLILDKFDSLVNDLSIGLPAELEARRKQYEYYRDRLLTFEEKR